MDSVNRRWSRGVAMKFQPSLTAIVLAFLAAVILADRTDASIRAYDFRPIRFRSECIHLEILPDQMTVTASYGFKVMYPDTFRMALKFPQDSTMGIPHLEDARIRFDDHRRKSLKVDTRQLPWEWLLPSTKKDSLRIELRWTQSLSSSRARYRLSAAEKWAGSLEHVRVEVEMPRDMGNPTFSFPMVEEGSRGETIMYVWEERDIRLEKDLLVTW